ncbi:DUF4105 domain-containing protein [Vibrio coralliilyticus]|jgi:hypothetical protein|uniref:Lnb N-terminal periplasmic domain-containing protein n=1 Tax=Vibrio coralliilyticus TaxID=190893 RepID=UPI0005032B75|nr:MULTISPECIES: DUF4105 domain-containing protein [Vibrio]KFI10474.1 hypothetical protein IX95_19495 [Vibrio sp. B183]NOI16781.1 DUF4105 domain-containing protein [Vibrio coralliilyticus]
MKSPLLKTSLLCGLSLSLLLPSASIASEFDVEQLSKHSYWHKLGHYLPALLSGYESTVDKSEFFLSEQGKYSPKAELEATISRLYSEDKQLALETQCQYPARYSWLEQQQGRQAILNCPELETWSQVIDPAGLTLVFPTAFMNNPSSMFGHTLLRVDAKDQTRHKELVAFAINFAAEPETDDNPALFAIKGLIGSYPGRYTVMPYYRKVREYNDIESRDIWEYKLKLNEEEVNRVLLHLWEMQRAEFDYYFLDENCSYQLLSLLDVAREDLSLTKDFSIQAIPSDTVYALAESGLLEEPQYREAFGTRLLHQANEADEKIFEAAKKATQGEYPSENEFSDEERAAILELAYEWLNFQLYDSGLERDPTAKRLTKLLYLRSRIKVESPFTPVPQPDVPPEKGHASARIGLSYQYWDEYSNQATIEWRAAYHDLLDSQDGFIPGAQINFLDTQVSIDQQGTSRLDRFYFIDTMALAPSNRVFDSWAWNIRTGFDRQPLSNKLAGRWFGQGGFGKAWGSPDKIHVYTLFSGAVSGGNLTEYDAVPGVGLETGAIFQAGRNHRIGLQAQYMALINSQEESHVEIDASWNWSFNRNFAVRTQLSYQSWQSENIGARLTGFIYY